MATLAVHVTPKSGRDEVTGWRGSELAVRVTAPPEGGKATAAVVKLIAGVLGVPKSAVVVARGDISRHKVLEIAGLDEAAIAQAVGRPEPSLFPDDEEAGSR